MRCSRRPRRRAALLPTIESSNPELARAILLLAMHESPENHRLAAIGLPESRRARLRVPALPARRRSGRLRRRVIRRDGQAMARLGHARPRVERCPSRAQLQQEVRGDLQHARNDSGVAGAAGRRRARLSERRGAQPARHLCAEQSLLSPDDGGRRVIRRALLRGGAGSRPELRCRRGTTSPSWKQGAGISSVPNNGLRTRNAKRVLRSTTLASCASPSGGIQKPRSCSIRPSRHNLR